MLAKLQAAATAKRQQRIEASVATIQKAWRRHCVQHAPAARFRLPPPLPERTRARRRPRGKQASGTLHGGADVEPLRAEAQGQSQTRSAQTTLTVCSCSCWPWSDHRLTRENPPDQLRFPPPRDTWTAPQHARDWPERRLAQKLVPPPPLPTRGAIHTRSQHQQRFSALSTGNDASSWQVGRGSTHADAYVHVVNNDIYKLLR